MEPTGPTNMSTPHRTAKLGNNNEIRKISGKELLYGVEKSYDPGVKLLDASAATAAREAQTRFQIRRGREELKETLERLKAVATRANTDNLETKRDAMRAIGGNLSKLRQAMARQK